MQGREGVNIVLNEEQTNHYEKKPQLIVIFIELPYF